VSISPLKERLSFGLSSGGCFTPVVVVAAAVIEEDAAAPTQPDVVRAPAALTVSLSVVISKPECTPSVFEHSLVEKG